MAGNTNAAKRDLTLTRFFNADLKKVWAAWTDQTLLQKWWGPRGVTNPICEWDARAGGRINIVMLAGKELGSFAGQRWPMDGTFKEVKPQSRIVYTSNALDDAKGVLIEGTNTVDFEELNGKTKMVLHIVVTKVDARGTFALQGMEQGWSQSLDKLAEFLALE